MLDETRYVSHKFAIITKIFNEHASYIGPDVVNIAKNKAGIITAGTQAVITAEQDENILKIIKNRAKLFNSKIKIENVDFFGRHTHEDCEENIASLKSSIDYGDFNLGIHGKYQSQNAALAVACAEIINNNKPIEKKIISSSLNKSSWPGRCQVLSKKPLIVLDATVSGQGAKDLLEFAKAEDYRHIFTVISVPDDKDAEGIIKAYSKESSFIIITGTYNKFLSYDFARIAMIAETFLKKNKFEIIENVRDSIKKVKSMSSKDDIILLSGTLSFVGDVLKIFNLNADNLW